MYDWAIFFPQICVFAVRARPPPPNCGVATFPLDGDGENRPLRTLFIGVREADGEATIEAALLGVLPTIWSSFGVDIFSGFLS
jgi:hypothetical protein